MSDTIVLGSTFPARRAPLIPSNVLGMSVFVLTEVMFFTALVSAFLVIKAGAGAWSPPAGAVLPVATTGLNTGVLLLSGVLLFLSGKAMRDVRQQGRAKLLFLQSIFLGSVFVGVQGYEWVQLVAHGMTLKANIFSTCFYLLIGSHALHAFAAIAVLIWFYATRVKQGRLTISQMTTLQIFWFFVVAVWPVLYGLVYF